MGQSSDFPFAIEDVVRLVGLNIRRSCSDGVYTDCPFCGDNRGKLKVNYAENIWRCNYCNESGGMLQLYAKCKGVSTSVAYRSICEALQNGETPIATPRPQKPTQPEAEKASAETLHCVYSALLEHLTLSPTHAEHLRSVRGLTDAQIAELGFKSTPPFYLSTTIAERLIGLGYTLAGVPGFYRKDGKWTVNFCSYTAGILLPIKSFDGKISGFQIRLDKPFKDDEHPKKVGTKYIWFSSAGKPGGTSSGSPVHLVGDRDARVVYVTEGALKADVAHCLTGRTFAAIAGANNLSSLERLFATLSANGTQLIVEAHDMDKYRNAMVDRGATSISRLAHKYGMACRRLTWNPNYKGVDDWQLALRRKQERKESRQPFKVRFMHGLCPYDEIKQEINAWPHNEPLYTYLGLTEAEYEAHHLGTLEAELLAGRTEQGFRIYQLDFDGDEKTHRYAFSDIDTLHQAGFAQPPASDYRLICDGVLTCGKDESCEERLAEIFRRYNDTLPADYRGRSLSPSDVVELYDTDTRRYYYRNRDDFCEVRFSPALAKPMKAG